MMAWDPSVYLAFDDLRTRPAMDLLARVRMDAPREVFDLGCGPGNSTALLRARWPEARIIGVDSSPEMLERARREGPQAEWIEADLTTFRPRAPTCLLFSNAAYQWVPDHLTVLRELMDCLAMDGALAVQMPANFDAASHRVIRETAAAGPWEALLRDLARPAGAAALEACYDALSDVAVHIDLWTTEYMQVLTGPDPVLAWVRGTALTPYLARLEGTDLERPFLEACAAGLRAAYPPRPDGVTLFPFRRLFFVAYR